MASRQAKIVYRRCPECAHDMHRHNFGDVSGVIVDRCHEHGYFLDAGELAYITAFIEGGGLAFTKKRRDAERAKQGGKSERERLADILIAQSGFNPWQYADQPQSHGDPVGDLLAWVRRKLLSRRR